MMNQITSFENLSKETIIKRAKELILCMEDLGLPNTFQIEKLKRINEPLYEKFSKQMKKKFSDLNARYPGIVAMILNYAGDFDFERLEMMLNLAQKIENKEVDETATHVQVSTELRNEYVLPKLGLTEKDVDDIDLNDAEAIKEKIKEMGEGKTNIKF